MVNFMKKVLVTDIIPEIGIDMLREHFEVDVNYTEEKLSKKEMIEKFNSYDGILSLLSDVIDEDIIKSCPNVKIIANYAVGFNNIDIEAAKKYNKIITNTPDVLADTTAETAWALLFAVSRRIVEADRYVRNGNWNKFSMTFMLGQDIYNKTLGIVGAGSIGRRFAEKARGYNMKINYFNRNRDFDFEKHYNAEYKPLNELLSESDFISLHVPLTKETHHLIGKEEFNLMKKNSILINTSRGPVVDEKELITALKSRKIYGAGLDVHEFEPHVPKELMELDNAVLLPHIGSASMETRNHMSTLAATNIINVLTGKAPPTPVF